MIANSDTDSRRQLRYKLWALSDPDDRSAMLSAIRLTFKSTPRASRLQDAAADLLASSLEHVSRDWVELSNNPFDSLIFPNTSNKIGAATHSDYRHGVRAPSPWLELVRTVSRGPTLYRSLQPDRLVSRLRSDYYLGKAQSEPTCASNFTFAVPTLLSHVNLWGDNLWHYLDGDNYYAAAKAIVDITTKRYKVQLQRAQASLYAGLVALDAIETNVWLGIDLLAPAYSLDDYNTLSNLKANIVSFHKRFKVHLARLNHKFVQPTWMLGPRSNRQVDKRFLLFSPHRLLHAPEAC